ncbi:hypothetical protein L6Q21_00100 [Sandaracinobacter sp. RS1-74]|uniref:hypothetical protein n=1 Tax=Sandaracinobacteroides sayramensis TaxID=2913411 RepID=UPI001EDAF45F|nr:hypothetical protein [Sandaracinobacteroides sayramensis]MCG2839377.1 hypothetical protein [Sandaracinobacteroides sayramensis]
MANAEQRPAPWHHWLVSLLAIVWNGFGAFDYSMTQLQGEVWLRRMNMTEAQIGFMNAMPGWAFAVWAVGVWGGVLGGLLLLFRSRFAAPVFLLSLAAFLLSLVNSYLLMNGAEVMGGPQAFGMNAIILAGCLFFLWYARRAAARGILR